MGLSVRSVPIPFGAMSYRSASLPWNAQRCVNWFAETAPPDAQSKTPFMLRPRPGLDAALSAIAGACRGHHTMAGILYGVYGNTLYSISAEYVPTALGTVAGSGSVTMADNGVQLTVVSEPNGWVYDTSGTVSPAFQQIIDPDFPGSKYVTQLNGYFVHVVPGDDGEFAVSNLNDGLAFDAFDFATAEANGDPLVACYANHGELWLFGTETIEPWGSSGVSDFPFAPIQSAKIERGCSAPFSITNYDNTMVWVGDDRIVYRANGYTPLRISTHPIEQLLQDSGDLSGLQGSWHTISGHAFFMLKNPGYWTFLYDAATGMWHERITFGLDWWVYGYPINVYNSVLVGGDNGNLYRMNETAATDAGSTIAFDVMSPQSFGNTARVFINRLQADMQTGCGLNDGQGSNPQAMLTWSKDGGRTWSSDHWRSMGKIGEYDRRVIWRRLGQCFQIMFRLVVTDPVRPVLLGAFADTEVTPA